MRASEATIRQRFAIGHEVLGVTSDATLVGAVCFVPTSEVPTNRARLPRRYAEFVSLPRSNPVRSVYIHNLAIDPRYRGGAMIWQLLAGLLSECRALGARWLVGNSRCAAYAGDEDPRGLRVPADPVFRAALDRWAASGRRPAEKTLQRDPLLRFYGQVLGCRFHSLAPDFAPKDHASGGYHVICVKDLDEIRGLLS